MSGKNAMDLTTQLDEIIEAFSIVAMKCVDIFFSRPCSVMEPWRLTDAIDCSTDRIVTIGYASLMYQAITAIGIDRENCFKLLGRPIDDPEFLDVFGEMANNYCALLMDMPDFTKRFGVLHQTVPVLHSSGMLFFPVISGVRGRIAIEGGSILNAGFSIKRR